MTQLLISVISLISLVSDTEHDESFAFDKSAPVIGSWVGTATTGGIKAFGTIDVEQSGQAFSVRGTLLKLKLNDALADEVTFDNSNVSFVFQTNERKLLFKGTVSSDGQSFEGTISTLGEQESGVQQTGVFELFRTLKPENCKKPRYYSGVITAFGGSQIETTLMLAETPKDKCIAWIDLPMFGLKQYPLSEVDFGNKKLTAKLIGAKAAKIEARFENNELNGEFQQGSFTLDLKLRINPNHVFRPINRPQEPKPPFPYRQREVVATHPDGHTLAGTLTLPEKNKFGSGPYPTAILISGGGSEDRDCSALGHKPFLVMADYLTRRGIAVMRFDDRGVGESKPLKTTRIGKHSTTQENATDTLAVFKRLKDIDNVDKNRIGLIGHSEGGAIAPFVCAADQSVAFVVMMAAPGVRGDKVFRKQMEFGWQLAGADPETIQFCSERYADLQRRIVESVTNEAIEKSARLMAKALVDSELETNRDEDTETKITNRLLEFNSRWWKFMFSYDPAENLSKVRCPILAMNGTKDCQVEHQQNLSGIQAAVKAAHGSITVRRYEGRNHIFQRCKTGAPSEYATIETTIDEQVLSDISDWILRICQSQDRE